MPETSILFFGLTSIKCAVKLRQNTSEQTILISKYTYNNAPIKVFMILPLSEDI